MSNIIDSIQLSGVTYDLAGSGGVSESAFTAYTAATDTVLANKADLSAATITSTSETSTTGTYFSYKMLSFEYDDGAYLFSATTENDYPFDNFSVTLKDAPNGNTVNIYLNTSTGETDSYILTESEYQSGSRTYATRTVTTKGNYRITYAYIATDGGGFSYDYGYKTRTVSSKAVSTYIEEDINPALSEKVDSNTYTAYTAATDTALAGKQTTLTAGTGINITNNVISATGGGGGNPTIELTQAQYDALVTAGTVQADTYYIITDAQAVDLTNYYTKSETNTLLGGKADTATTYTKTEVDNAITAATSTKQDTLVSGTNIKTINNTSILGSGNIDIQGGGGKTIEAGRGISITTGETADTVSINLPISAGTGTNSIKCGETSQASATDSFAIGSNGVKASGLGSFAGGSYSEAKQAFSMAFGRYAKTNNYGEAAFGFYNKTNGSSSQIGNNSSCTLFSVGNGTSVFGGEHNAFEIRQNGDIYLTLNGQDVKLQDQLGGGGGGSSYTAGTGIDITNNVISVNSGVVTTDKVQDITGNKTFIGSANTSQKPIIFKQANNSHKIGFVCQNTASANNELASFEFRPNTFTIDNVQHPLMYFGHYRNTNTANAGVPQTVIGFRQYDQKNGAAYHYLMPLPEKAKTPFSLTTSFKDYYAPMGFKNGSTMITADNTGVVDLSSELGGLKLKKLTQAEYDALATKDNSTLYVIVN